MHLISLNMFEYILLSTVATYNAMHACNEKNLNYNIIVSVLRSCNSDYFILKFYIPFFKSKVARYISSLL